MRPARIDALCIFYYTVLYSTLVSKALWCFMLIHVIIIIIKTGSFSCGFFSVRSMEIR